MREATKITLISLLALFVAQRAQGSIQILTNTDPSLQYHVQTDQGPDRFFRFQTETGQFRKEQRHPDGSVTGSYGWVDPSGIFRLFDYVSDNRGYRIVQQKLYKVGSATNDVFSLDTRGGNVNLGFEVFPLDFESEPTFASQFSSRNNHPDSLTVSSLTSNTNVANPLSKQGQATFFEGSTSHFEPRTEERTRQRIVIGARANERKPASRRPTIVIGAARSSPNPTEPKFGETITPIVIGAGGNDNYGNFNNHGQLSGRTVVRSRPGGSGIVIGHTK